MPGLVYDVVINTIITTAAGLNKKESLHHDDDEEKEEEDKGEEDEDDQDDYDGLFFPSQQFTSVFLKNYKATIVQPDTRPWRRKEKQIIQNIVSQQQSDQTRWLRP